MDFIYLDHAATTPLRPEVAEVMARARTRAPGNPSSVHRWGRDARELLETARRDVAELLGRAPREVRFTRGGTEANNLALLGRFEAARTGKAGEVHLGISALEHSAVREAAAAAEARGARVTVLPVAPTGRLGGPALRGLLERSPAVISVQRLNPEVGLILAVEEVVEACAEAGVPLHVDAVQAPGRAAMPRPGGAALLVTLAGHKIGGPRSAGVLVVPTDLPLEPLLFGGGQERGLRPGTEDVEGAVGFAEALRLALDEGPAEAERLRSLRDGLERRLLQNVPGLRVHGTEGPRAPHILNVGVPGLPPDVLPGALDLEGVGVSAGSACRSGSAAPSATLAALYGDRAAGAAPVRISLGRSTTAEEVEEAGLRIVGVVERMLAVGVGPEE
jgi:cysteine desulfurase